MAESKDDDEQNINDDDDILLVEPCELIAPMTRIRGQFKLTSTSLSFTPNQKQKCKPNEINLATNPPPIVASKSTSPKCKVYKKMETHTLNSLSLSNSNEKNGKKRSNSQLEQMVMKNEENDNDDNEETEYWIAINVCSSYQQVGGTRYRLMNAKRFWFIDELLQCHYRRYQLRNCAIELFFNDDTSWLFTFENEKSRNRVFDRIISLDPANLIETVEYFQNPKKAIKSSQIHYKWCRREISNFEYLMKLNILAGRSYNDITQYPVVPWIITDFISDKLDLSDEKIFRDLSKPVGALCEESLEKFKERYYALKEDDDENAFMYGTHYSSVGVVFYYLLRMQPFTTYNLKFQDGKFDHSDRLFHSIADCFDGCLKNSSDVKELIPEFYYLSDFLSNEQNLDLGTRQCDDVKVHDVILPPWAKGSAETFVKIMRNALESEYVSMNLHHWIDLIFGYKQKGKEAEKAFNVFHPYTYEGNVQIDQIEDPTARRAILAQIDEYGQCPMQLFTEPHEQRFKQSEVLKTIFKSKKVKYYGVNSMTDGDDNNGTAAIAKMGKKQIVCIDTDYCLNIHKWNEDKMSIEQQKSLSFSKLLSFGKGKKENKIGGDVSLKIIDAHSCFAVTNDGLYAVAAGFSDCSFVIWDVVNSKVIKTIKTHQDIVSCLALAENSENQTNILVTGSYDKSVIVWRINKNDLDIEQILILDNQLSAIISVDISLKSGLIVCCSLDGIVNIYNSSTGDHYQMLQPFVDKAMKDRKEAQLRHQKELHRSNDQITDEKKEENDDNDNDSSGSEAMKPLKNGIECSVLSTVRVSDVFGHIICYSKQTKDIFLYSSKGKLLNVSTSHPDVYNDVQFSATGNHIICGGKDAVIRIKELPSFRTKKKFREPTKYKFPISSIYLSNNETSLFVGTANGNVFVYSLPHKAFVKVRVGALDRLGF